VGLVRSLKIISAITDIPSLLLSGLVSIVQNTEAIAPYPDTFLDYWWASSYGVGMGRRWQGQFLIFLESVDHALPHSVRRDVGKYAARITASGQ
jgi:hypothetical protein